MTEWEVYAILRMHDKVMTTEESNTPGASSILDQIMGSQTQTSLSEFMPVNLVLDLLASLKDRDREILSKRFGLDGAEIETLEAIGKRYKLTRERVRQIEKDSLNLLKKKKGKQLEESLQLIFDMILEHGNIMSEEFLMQSILTNKSDLRELRAIRFLLNLGEQFNNLKETPRHHESWSVVGFDLSHLETVVQKFEKILEEQQSVMSQALLFEKAAMELSEKVLRSYLAVIKSIQVNPFSEVGLTHWSEVRPRDVGDKAYLVLKHHGKPEHYSEITKMINDYKFDDRTAYQETVHNELIKDGRFVLIGRGIYALSEWGYKKGVVADVIRDVLKSLNRPLTRDEIIDEVLKRRQVKRNTILVGLSNRKNFSKVGKDKYTLAETNS